MSGLVYKVLIAREALPLTHVHVLAVERGGGGPVTVAQ